MFEYSIQYNVRSKRIKLKVSNLGEVQVISPPGVSRGEIHRFVEKNTAWVHKTVEKLKDSRLSDPDLGLKPPKKIILQALSKSYSLHYLPVSDRLTVIENESSLSVHASTDIEQTNLLRIWLQKKAKQHLVPWLDDASFKHKIRYNKVSIRGQKTRWGSCSSKKNINLNRNLLFVRSALVDYLMAHELSHIIHPNHSNKFWQQVGECEPNYQMLDNELNQAQKIVPLWAGG